MELAMSGDSISKARGANVELVYRLVLRNLNVKYQRSALGFLWTLIHPAVMAAVIIAVFTQIVRIPIEQYWAFLISGFFY